MNDFERENRYIVIKRSDLVGIEKLLSKEAWSAFETIDLLINQIRSNNGKHPLLCVVVEHGWPEYEAVWQMIESRITEKSNKNLTRKQAIKLFLDATNHDDPYWDNLVDEFYDESSDTWPDIYDVLRPLGVSKEEINEAESMKNDT